MMKKLRKLKLNQLSETLLNEQEMKVLVGGGTACNCTCWAAGQGGSQSPANDSANSAEGYTISGPGVNPGGCGGDGGGENPNTRPSECEYCMEVNTNYFCYDPVNCSNDPSKC